jgi:hypothetical protein
LILLAGLRCSARVDGKLKSTGDGGGARVSLMPEEREARVEALNAALSSGLRGAGES